MWTFTGQLGGIAVQPTSESSDSSDTTSSSESSSPSSLSAPSISSIEEEVCSSSVPHCPSFKIVGDNIDKHIKPREMRLDAQAKSLNFFNSYAVKGRIDVSNLEDKPSLPNYEAFQSSSILPSNSAGLKIKRNFITLIARVLKKYFPFFTKFSSATPRHIKHMYSSEMAQKSEVVSN